MLTFEQERELIRLNYERKWDNTYKLPNYVENYIVELKKLLPRAIEIRPWTNNRAVSFFHEKDYICSLTYDYIENITNKTKKAWYIKFWNKIKGMKYNENNTK